MENIFHHRRISLTETSYLLPIHESIFLNNVNNLQRHILFASWLVAYGPIFITHNTTFSSRHLNTIKLCHTSRLRITDN